MCTSSTIVFLGHGAVDDMLDAENKHIAENLANKLSRLKSLAYDIDKEAEEQNSYLDGMVCYPVSSHVKQQDWDYS